MADIDPAFVFQDEAALRAHFPPTHDIAKAKVLDHVDTYVAEFIARSPFICIGTQTKDGRADVSPRGDPKGFVKVHDPRTLLIPDRPGNNRLDTLSNIINNPAVGILFMVPGFDETMRVNGKAVVTRDPALLETMAVNDRVPSAAIVVHIDEVFIHCAKAFRRADLWNPEKRQDRKEMPSLIKIVLDQIDAAPEDDALQAKHDADLEKSYRITMY